MLRIPKTRTPTSMLHQAINLVGAFMILGAYIANQRGWLTPANRAYSALNLVGSLLLLWIAVIDVRWGFILLEAAWAAVSIPTLINPPTESDLSGPAGPLAAGG